MEQPAQQSGAVQSHTDPIKRTVQEAMMGYSAKHPNATDAEVVAFANKVEARVRATQRPSKSLELKKARTARRLALLEKVKEHKLKVAYARLLEDPIFGGTSATGGISIAYRVEDGKTVLSAAICSMDDNFDYLVGRELAVDRFVQGLTVGYPVPDIEELQPGQLRRDYCNLLQNLQDADLQ